MLVSSIALVWNPNGFGRMAVAVDEQNQRSVIFSRREFHGFKVLGNGRKREGCSLVEMDCWRQEDMVLVTTIFSLAGLSSSASLTGAAIAMYFRLAENNVMSWRVKYQKP